MSKTNKLNKLEQLYMEDGSLPEDLSELREMYEEDGGDMSSAKFTHARQESLRPIREENDEERRNARQRPEAFTAFRNKTLNLRDGISMLFALLLFSIFPLTAVAMLFVSEVLSAILGAKTFLGGDFLEDAVTVVLGLTITAFFFVLEWRSASLKYHYNLNRPKVYKRTFADFWRMTRYRFSTNPDIERLEISDTTQINATSRMAFQVMVLLVVLGILGRVGNDLEKYNNITWHETIIKILTDSTLNEFLELFAGGFIAFILLNATSYILGMVYENFAEIGGDETDNFFSESSGRQRLIEQETRFMRTAILNRMKKRGRYIEQKVAKMEQGLPEDNQSQEESESETMPNSETSAPVKQIPVATIPNPEFDKNTNPESSESNPNTPDDSTN